MNLLNELKKLADEGVIRFLDYQLAKLMFQLGAPALEQYVAAAVSYSLGQGHVCLSLPDLKEVAMGLSRARQKNLHQHIKVPTKSWLSELQGSGFIGDKNDSQQPIVFQNERLYLQRYWHYEQEIKQYLQQLSGRDQFLDIQEPLQRLFKRDYQLILDNYQSSDDIEIFCEKYLDMVKGEGINWPEVQEVLSKAATAADLDMLDQLIPEANCLNWQKLASAVSVAQPFSVISGGPGTGKTTTIIKVLALLVELHQQQSQQPHQKKNANPLVIKLAAPTGKAAARLTESIGNAKQRLDLPVAIAEQIPEQSSTLHRLLGIIPGRGQSKHHKHNPLHLDVLVLDEASMIDLPMMAMLLDALPPKARLILLGDKDQLASVEAGAVLGDICSFYQQGYSKQQIQWLVRSTGNDLSCIAENSHTYQVANGLSLLQKSYRFDARSGIGQLAKIVNMGDLAGLKKIWQQGFQDIQLHSDNQEGANSYRKLLDLVVKGYKGYLSQLKAVPQEQANDYAQRLLAAFAQCQVLAAVREGDFGVEGLNQRIAQALQSSGLINQRSGDWYAGRPVMIIRNDYSLGLFNGDVGLCLAEINECEEEQLRVYFQLPDGSIKSFLPSRLPAHETAYAMTIHKSQGSEFTHTLMVLPARDNPVLSRELVYTGITRAKQQLDIFSSNEILINAVKRPTARNSGLATLLGEFGTEETAKVKDSVSPAILTESSIDEVDESGQQSLF